MKLFALVLLLLPEAAAFAEEDYGLNAPSFLPFYAHVGDPVLYHVELVVPARARISQPPAFPAEISIEVTDVKVSLRKTFEGKNVYDVSVAYVSFAPGTQSLPPLPLGDVTLRDIEVNTLSVLDQGETVRLSPPRGQVVLPSTWLVIVLASGTAAGLAGAVVALVVFLRRLVSRVKESRKRRLPARRLAKALRLLDGRRGQMDYREYAAGITGITKAYLSERLGFPALVSTTSEIRGFFGRANMSGRAESETTSILRDADEVKFGDRPLDDRGMAGVALRVANLPALVDEEEDSHVER